MTTSLHSACLCMCVRDLRRALLHAKKCGTEVELLTCAPPPAGRPPNIIGVVTDVNLGSVELCLTRGPRGRKAIFSLCHLIAVIPTRDEEEEE